MADMGDMGDITYTLVLLGERGCFPSTFGVNGCMSIPTASEEKSVCFCNTEL